MLREWSVFLDSEDSLSVLNTGPDGWLSPAAAKQLALDDFHLTRQERLSLGFRLVQRLLPPADQAERPAPSPRRTIPRSSCRPTTARSTRIARGVRRVDSFWLKSQPYSLADTCSTTTR